jgi:hypothetical protein
MTAHAVQDIWMAATRKDAAKAFDTFLPPMR